MPSGLARVISALGSVVTLRARRIACPTESDHARFTLVSTTRDSPSGSILPVLVAVKGQRETRTRNPSGVIRPVQCLIDRLLILIVAVGLVRHEVPLGPWISTCNGRPRRWSTAYPKGTRPRLEQSPGCSRPLTAVKTRSEPGPRYVRRHRL